MSFSAFARIFEPHALAPPTKARLTAYGLGDCLYYFEYVAGPKFFNFCGHLWAFTSLCNFGNDHVRYISHNEGCSQLIRGEI